MTSSTSEWMKSYRSRLVSCGLVAGMAIIFSQAAWAGWAGRTIPLSNGYGGRGAYMTRTINGIATTTPATTPKVCHGTQTRCTSSTQCSAGVACDTFTPLVFSPSARVPCCGSGGVLCGTTTFPYCATPAGFPSDSKSVSQVQTVKVNGVYQWGGTTFATCVNGIACDSAQLDFRVTPVSPLAHTALDTTDVQIASLPDNMADYDITIHWLGTDAGTAQELRFIQYCQDIPGDIQDISELVDDPPGCLKPLATIFSPNVTLTPGTCSLTSQGCTFDSDCPANVCTQATEFSQCSQTGADCGVASPCPVNACIGGGATTTCAAGSGFCIGGPNDDESCASASECPGGVCSLTCNLHCIGGGESGSLCTSAAGCPAGVCSSGWDKVKTIHFTATSDTSKIYTASDGIAVSLPGPVSCSDRIEERFTVDRTLDDYVLFASA